MLNNDRKSSAKYCDINLIVDEHEYPAHKCILRDMCPFFEKIVCAETKAFCGDEIVIEGVSEEVLDIILDFIYTGEVTMGNEFAYLFSKAADYLGLEYNLRPNWWNFMQYNWFVKR